MLSVSGCVHVSVWSVLCVCVCVGGVYRGRLTCPADRVAGGGREDLRGKVLKGHDLSKVLHNGLQIESTLLVAGGAPVKGQDTQTQLAAEERLDLIDWML